MRGPMSGSVSCSVLRSSGPHPGLYTKLRDHISFVKFHLVTTMTFNNGIVYR